MIPDLNEAGFAAIPITLPGLGEPPLEAQSFRKADLAAWLSGVLSRRGVTRFALIGHDWGATVAVHLAAHRPSAVSALVIEEEILPGIDVDIPDPGSEYYPTWHGPFNRSPGLAEQLVPGREAAFYGSFLQQSAGPAGLDPEFARTYVDAYSAPGILVPSLGYYRTGTDDVQDVQSLARNQIPTPVLATGGHFAMGTAVAAGARAIATDVTGLILPNSGHYPLEQEPALAGPAVIQFLRQHH